MDKLTWEEVQDRRTPEQRTADFEAVRKQLADAITAAHKRMARL